MEAYLIYIIAIITLTFVFGVVAFEKIIRPSMVFDLDLNVDDVHNFLVKENEKNVQTIIVYQKLIADLYGALENSDYSLKRFDNKWILSDANGNKLIENADLSELLDAFFDQN